MKKLLFVVLMLMAGISYGQSKAELKKEIETLKARMEFVESDLKELQKENQRLKDLINSKGLVSVMAGDTVKQKTAAVKNQCKAITKAGTQCSRMASEGSEFCWQHQSKDTTTPVKTYSKSSGGATYTGPRGGIYHYSSSGKKVYTKRR
jgi:regulator of replication initiation timing